jgi:hypothetical protein
LAIVLGRFSVSLWLDCFRIPKLLTQDVSDTRPRSPASGQRRRAAAELLARTQHTIDDEQNGRASPRFTELSSFASRQIGLLTNLSAS